MFYITSQVYDNLDLADFDRTFSAYQKVGDHKLDTCTAYVIMSDSMRKKILPRSKLPRRSRN